MKNTSLITWIVITVITHTGWMTNMARADEQLIERAHQGDAEAQYKLGYVYFVTQVYEEATRWLEKAAEQGIAEAQYDLGVMYAKGEGVMQDDMQAVYWFTKAAEQGFADAKEALKKLGITN